MPSRSRGRLTLVPTAGATGRKPMLPVRQVSLFEKEVRIGLSGAAIDLLFDKARVLSEGQCQAKTYFGSTMLTMDLGHAAPRVREQCDAFTATLIAPLVAADPRVRARATALAAREAESCAGRPLTDVHVDMHARATGSHVHVDLDIEARVSAALHAIPSRD